MRSSGNVQGAVRDDHKKKKKESQKMKTTAKVTNVNLQ